MPADMQSVVQRMVEAGEPEADIRLVIEHYGQSQPKATAPPPSATIGMMQPSRANDAGHFPTPDDLLTGWQNHGPQAMGLGAKDLAHGNFASGARQIISGAGVTAAPLLAATFPGIVSAAVAAPVATGLTIAGGIGGQQIGERGAKAFGASDDQAALAGEVGALAGGYGGAKLRGAVPGIVEGAKRLAGVSKVRAGANIEAAATAAQGVAVNPEGVGAAGLRALELKAAGGRMPQVASKLMERITKPDAPDLTFAEARDFYSNLSRLSANEFGSLNPTMQRQVGAMKQALHESLTDAAGTVGAGEQYATGIDEYANASKRAAQWEKTIKPMLTATLRRVAQGAGLAGAFEAGRRALD